MTLASLSLAVWRRRFSRLRKKCEILASSSTSPSFDKLSDEIEYFQWG
jgi:hypothetical protein